MLSESEPIFVRRMSRSGGALMCTLLDAHGDIAMSYELYPALVETGSDVDLRSFAAECAPTAHFSTFVARSQRGGLCDHDFARLRIN